MSNGNEREYKTLVTAIGKSKIAAVIQGGDKVNITQMAVGDGNGAFYIPNANMTTLVHEVWRGNIAGKWINEHSANMVDVKVVLPADVGGFTVREAALFDEDNNMIAICNVPDTEKAVITTGAAGTLTLIMHIVLTDVDAVEFTIDPYLDVVTITDMDSAFKTHNADMNAHSGLLKAKKISYDNNKTEIEAENVQDVLDTFLDETLPNLIEDTNAVKVSVEEKISISEKAVANGVASLDENGKVPLEQIPEGIGMHPRIDVTVSASTTVSVKSDTTTLTQTGTDVVSFDIPHFGTWTVTAGNYKRVVEVDTVKVYEVMALPLGSTSWETIAEISASGKASSIWSIGDEFEKYISGLGERLTFVIVGFDQDDIAGDRGKAGITFGMKNLSKTLRSMESTNTNANSFTGSNLYKWLESICTNGNFGYDLIHAMKKINKRTSEGNTSKNIRTDAVKLFLFSKGEVFGYAAVEGEGLQYPYFATASNRTKYLDNGAGAASNWWLRSPYPSSNEKFECVSSSGNSYVSGSSATSEYGVCFGFCV